MPLLRGQNLQADVIAADHCRLNRIREIEESIFFNRDAGEAFFERSKELDRLTLL